MLETSRLVRISQILYIRLFSCFWTEKECVYLYPRAAAAAAFFSLFGQFSILCTSFIDIVDGRRTIDEKLTWVNKEHKRKTWKQVNNRLVCFVLKSRWTTTNCTFFTFFLSHTRCAYCTANKFLIFFPSFFSIKHTHTHTLFIYPTVLNYICTFSRVNDECACGF